MSIWWEKTVEYKFIVEYVTKFFIKPLSGREEKAVGDAIVESARGFIVIEFKRYRKSLYDEDDKYKKLPQNKNYTIFATRAIHGLNFNTNTSAIPHYFIYGVRPQAPLAAGTFRYNEASIMHRTRKSHSEAAAESNAKRASIAFPELEIRCRNYWTHTPALISELAALPAFKTAIDLVNYIANLAEIRDSENEAEDWRNSIILFECFNQKYFGSIVDILPIIQKSIRYPKKKISLELPRPSIEPEDGISGITP